MTQDLLSMFRAWGSKGGKKRWKGITKEKRSEIARKSAAVRSKRKNGEAKP